MRCLGLQGKKQWKQGVQWAALMKWWCGQHHWGWGRGWGWGSFSSRACPRWQKQPPLKWQNMRSRLQLCSKKPYFQYVQWVNAGGFQLLVSDSQLSCSLYSSNEQPGRLEAAPNWNELLFGCSHWADNFDEVPPRWYWSLF